MPEQDCDTCFQRPAKHFLPESALCADCYNGYLQTCTRVGGGMECDCAPDRCAMMEYTPDDS